MKARTRWIAGAATIAVVALGAALVLNGDDGGRIRLPFDLGQTSSAEGSPQVTDAGTRALEIAADPVTPPETALAPDETSGETASDPAYEAYKEETARIVTENADSMEALGAAVLAAYEAGDSSVLSAAFAPDEGASTADARALLGRYPKILRGEGAANVNVFAVRRVTLYVYYLNVQWLDGGLESSHSIEVPMRFVDGVWYVSNITPSSGDARFVQSVRMP